MILALIVLLPCKAKVSVSLSRMNTPLILYGETFINLAPLFFH